MILKSRTRLFAAFTLIFALSFGLYGCGLFQGEPPLEEEPTTEPLPDEVQEVVEKFWDGFSGGDYEMMNEYLADELEGKVKNMNQLASEHYILPDADILDSFAQLDITIDDHEKEDEQYVLTVSVEHPKVTRQDHEVFFEELDEIIDSRIEDEQRVDFRRRFSAALDEFSVNSGITDVKMRVDDSTDTPQITQIQDLDVLFASFSELFESAVCDRVSDVHIVVDEDGRIYGDSPAHVNYAERTVTSDAGYMLECMTKQATIQITDDISLSAGRIVDQLSSEPFDWEALDRYLQMGPEDFIYRALFVVEEEDNLVASFFERPYAVATIDTVVGVFDPSADEIDFFEMIPGTVDFTEFSPHKEYLAVAWTQAGKGDTDVHVYELDTQEITSLAELLGEDHYAQIERLQWEGPELLEVKTVGIDEEETETTWYIDLEENELKSDQ